MEKPLIKYFKDGEWHYATVKDIGDLDTLNTLEKSTIVDAINSIVIDGKLSNEATINILNQIKDKVQIVEGKIDTHIIDKNNPHKVTTEQIGTYNKETIDSKDSSILSQAKSYVDGIKNSLTTIINNVRDSTYTKTDIDNKDSNILTQAKNYVNGVKDTLEQLISNAKTEMSNSTYTRQEIDSKDTSTLSNAKGYADEKKIEANSYTNTQIDSAKKEIINGNVASATKLQTARNINGVLFDGTRDITLSVDNIGTYSKADINSKDTNVLGQAKAYIDTNISSAKTELNNNIAREKANIIAGNVASATKLHTARNINGVAFDGTRDISISAGQVGAYTKNETDSKDNNILSQSKSYTDGKFTPLNNTVNSINGRVGTAETNINNINNRINDTTIIARAGNGKQLTSDPFFDDGTNGIVAYNNSNNGTVTITRENPSGGTQPTGHMYRLRIVHTGTASPNLGGFMRRTNSRNNAEFVVKFNANLPSGASLSFHNNLIGNASSIKWLTSNLGTGTWEEYSYYVKCGSSGTFQDFGFTSINYNKTPTPSAPLTWYVSSFEIYDISSSQSETIGLMERNISSIRNDLTNHTNNRSNPHSVTASQVGAYTKAEVDRLIGNAKSSITTSSIGTYSKSEIDTKDTNTLNSAKSYADGKATSVQNNLNGHTNNRSNPHGVTASQVGTYTKQEIDSKDSSTLSSAKSYADGKANTVQNNLNSHTGNRSNPHGVTASQVGAYSKSETYSRTEVDNKVIAGVGNIDVGGTNLLDGTKEFRGLLSTNASYKGYWNGLKYYGIDSINKIYVMAEWKFTDFKYDEVFTFSFWAKGNVNKLNCYFYGDSGYVGARAINSNMFAGAGGNDGACFIDVSKLSASEWRRVYITWKVNPSSGGGNLSVAKRILIRTYGATSGSLYICGAKMERGNVATDWSPSVNDMTTDDELNDLRNHVIFVGTESQWNGLSSAEKNKYILKAIVE